MEKVNIYRYLIPDFLLHEMRLVIQFFVQLAFFMGAPWTIKDDYFLFQFGK